MRSKFYLIVALFIFAIISCNPQVDLDSYDVTHLFSFAQGDTKDSVTQPFSVKTADKGGITIEFNAPDSLIFNDGTFSIDWKRVNEPNQETIITCKVSSGENFVFKTFVVILNRKLGLVDFDELILFSNQDDSLKLVTQDFTLVLNVPGYNEDVSWSGFESYSDILSYNSSNGHVKVTRKNENVNVTLKATFSKERFESVTKEVSLVIADSSVVYSYAPNDIKPLITLASGDYINRISKNFTVATTIPQDGSHKDVSVSWSCVPASAITFNGDTATVNNPSNALRAVTITASFQEENAIAVNRQLAVTLDPYSFATEDIEDLVNLQNGGKDFMWRVRDNFTFATSISATATHEDITISWASSNTDVIAINGENAQVKRGLSSNVVTLTATFKEGDRVPVNKECRVVVMEQIDDTLVVNGQEYKLIYFDAFDNMEILKANWDIGNPGNDGSKLVGNPGGNPVYYKSPDGQFHGYANEQKKWPLWSPRAVRIVDGRLFIDIKYDNEINRGVVGAVFSMRRFPYGLYVARWNEKRENTNHWDAYWLDTNHPFSKAQGKKMLNLPKALRSKVTQDSVLGEGFFNNNAANIQKGNDAVSSPIMYQSKYTLVTNTKENANWNFVQSQTSGTIGRMYNAEQRYELDVFELPYANNSPSEVMHFWGWMRGTPGSNPDNPWDVGSVARDADKFGHKPTTSLTKNYVGSTFFTFSGLYSPSEISFYTSGNEKPIYNNSTRSLQATNNGGKINNSDVLWPNDEFNPIEVLFSIEPGTNWFGNSGVPNGEPYKSGHVDYMEIEYFAFYAPSNALVNKNIGGAEGVSLTPITDKDNVKESEATLSKLTKGYK